MPFMKISYNKLQKRLAVYSSGCNFRCTWCSYKLNKGETKSIPRLTLEDIAECAEGLDIEELSVLGGEPTLNPDLPNLLKFGKEVLHARTCLGHSNGSGLPVSHLDMARVSLKTSDPELHLRHTGYPLEDVLERFKSAWARGIELEASTVLIPGLVDRDDVLELARFVSSVDPGIPFRIIGYISVPNQPWRSPSREEVESAAESAQQYLEHVTWSALTHKDFELRKERNIAYRSVVLADSSTVHSHGMCHA